MEKRIITLSSNLLVLSSLILALFVSSSVFAANIARENFEGTGFEITWVKGGTAYNEDYACPEDSSGFLPPGVGSECAKSYIATSPGQSYATYDYGSALTTTFHEIYFNIISVADVGATPKVFVLAINATTGQAVNLAIKNDSGTYKLQLQYYSSGAWQTAATTPTITTNHWYRFEFMYDASTAHLWEWRLDGATIDSGSLANTHRAGIAKIRLGFDDNTVAGSGTILFDKFAFNDNSGSSDNTWVGIPADSTFTKTTLTLNTATATDWTAYGGSVPAILNDSDDNTYIYIHAPTADKNETFTLTGYPADSAKGRIYAIRLWARGKIDGSAPDRAREVILRYNSQNSSNFYLSTNWTDYYNTWWLNNSTPFTWADLEALTVTMRSAQDPGTADWKNGGQVSKMWLEVFHGPASGGMSDYSPVFGNVTNNQIKVFAKMLRPPYSGNGTGYIRLKYCSGASCTPSSYWPDSSGTSVTSSSDWSTIFTVTGLSASTLYRFDIETSTDQSNWRSAHTDNGWSTYPQVLTYGAVGDDTNFDFLMISDAHVPGDADSFSQIINHTGISFVFSNGDLGADNPGSDQTKRRQMWYNQLAGLSPKAQSEIFWKFPFAYIWDDHDAWGDNCNKMSFSDTSAHITYEQIFPTPTRPLSTAIYHKVQIHNADFLLLDDRSRRDCNSAACYGCDLLDGTRTTSSCLDPTPKKSGTADGTYSNGLYESSGGFSANVHVGDLVKNTTDGTYAIIKQKVDDTHILLFDPKTGNNSNIFDNGNENYQVYESGASEHGTGVTLWGQRASDSKATNEAAGHYQREYLIDGINNSTAKWKFICWGTPFNKTLSGGYDKWGDFDPLDAQLEYLKAVLTANNIISLSGDRHWAAIDNGTNSYWVELLSSTMRVGNMTPVGTWSEGTKAKEGSDWHNYFAVIEVRSTYVNLKVYNETDTLVLSYTINLSSNLKEVADTFSLSDSAYRNKTFSIDDIFPLSDDLGTLSKLLTILDAIPTTDQILVPTKNVLMNEIITISDIPLKGWSPQISDTVGILDTSFITKLLQILDVLQFSESILRNRTFSIPDSIGILDSLSVQKLLIISEAIGITERILTNKTFTILDLMQLAEAINIVKGALKEVSDSISFTDAIYRNKAFTVNDTLPSYDFIYKNWSPQVIDTMAIIETILRNKTFTINDVIQLNETASTITNIIKEVLDSIGMTDAVLANKTFSITEIVGLSEAIAMPLKNLIITEQISITDLTFAMKILILTDRISIQDAVNLLGEVIELILGSEVPPRNFGVDAVKRFFGTDVPTRTFGTTVPARIR